MPEVIFFLVVSAKDIVIIPISTNFVCSKKRKEGGGFLFGMKMGRGRIDRLKDEVRSRLTDFEID